MGPWFCVNLLSVLGNCFLGAANETRRPYIAHWVVENNYAKSDLLMVWYFFTHSKKQKQILNMTEPSPFRELSVGRGSTAPVGGGAFPKVNTVEPWDGKDGEVRSAFLNCAHQSILF